MAVKRLLRMMERAFAINGVFLLLYLACFDLSVISSPSMSPTLQGNGYMQGDRVLTEKVSLHFRKPRRWEVVTFINEEFGSQVMKRVVGLPGEWVALQETSQTLVVNGSPVARPASLAGMKYLAFGNMTKGANVKCGEGYFVLGDYSQDSQDSRWTGPIRREVIRGRAWLILWPPRRAGFVNP
jgi:signal peptidase I